MKGVRGVRERVRKLGDLPITFTNDNFIARAAIQPNRGFVKQLQRFDTDRHRRGCLRRMSFIHICSKYSDLDL